MSVRQDVVFGLAIAWPRWEPVFLSLNVMYLLPGAETTHPPALTLGWHWRQLTHRRLLWLALETNLVQPIWLHCQRGRILAIQQHSLLHSLAGAKLDPS